MTDITWDGSKIIVALGDSWRRLLENVLNLLPVLEADEAVAARLNPAAYQSDEHRENAYRQAVDEELVAVRDQDRAAVAASIWSTSVDTSVAECWMRVIGDVRLALATRHDVDEISLSRADDTPTRLIHMLGHIQDQLVMALDRAAFGPRS